MADWVDKYFETAIFDVDGLSVGCRVKLPQPIQKTASDALHFNYHASMDPDGALRIEGLSMHIEEAKDDG